MECRALHLVQGQLYKLQGPVQNCKCGDPYSKSRKKFLPIVLKYKCFPVFVVSQLLMVSLILRFNVVLSKEILNMLNFSMNFAICLYILQFPS